MIESATGQESNPNMCSQKTFAFVLITLLEQIGPSSSANKKQTLEPTLTRSKNNILHRLGRNPLQQLFYIKASLNAIDNQKLLISAARNTTRIK